MTAIAKSRFRFTIGRKLGIGLGLLGICLAGVIFIGVSGMASMHSAHNDVVKVGVPKQLAADTARAAAADLHFSETRYVLAGPASRADYLTDRHTFELALNHLASLSTSAADRPLMAAIQSAIGRFDRGDAALWALVQANNSAAATKLVEGSQNDSADALTETFSNYQKRAGVVAASQTTKFESVASSSQTLMLVLGLTAAAAWLLTAATAASVVRRLSRGVRGALNRLSEIVGSGSTRLTTGLRALAAGDLTVDLHATTDAKTDFGADEVGEIERTTERVRDMLVEAYAIYNETTGKLRSLIGQVSTTANSVGEASGQMATTSDETGRATAEIAHAIEHVAQGAERQVQTIANAKLAAGEVTAAVRRSAEQAEQTAEVAVVARETAQQGVIAAGQASVAMQSVRDSSEAVTEAIRELADKSGQIGTIVQAITTIAEQTNLLALNAAIEAARAGDQGRGFAVVAEEVRKLAEESQHAAQEISALIGAIQHDTTAAVQVVEDGARRTADGTSVVEQTREAFISIDQAVEDMTTRVEEIAAAAQQITTAATTMNDSIDEAAAIAEESSASTEEVSASTEQTSASTEQVAAGAAEMANSADALRGLVAQFRIHAADRA